MGYSARQYRLYAARYDKMENLFTRSYSNTIVYIIDGSLTCLYDINFHKDIYISSLNTNIDIYIFSHDSEVQQISPNTI